MPDLEANLKRSGRVADLVLVYRQRVNDDGNDDDTTAIDLLTDMRHWADTYGVDFDYALDRSLEHYTAETTGEGD